MNPSTLNSQLSTASAALLYRRVSTDHQDNSLAVQEHLNDEYCTRLQLPVTTSYADEDMSGSIPFLERPGGRALLNRLKQGDLTAVVTSKQDRLGRDTLDCIRTIRTIWALGVTPHFPAEGGPLPRTPQNELLFEIKASVAQYERNLIKERTTAVLRHKARKGELTGTVPYGWDCRYTFADGHSELSAIALPAAELAARTARHGAVTGKQLEANEREQRQLRQLAAWRAGGWSLKQIADELNYTGVRSKRGGLWQCGNVDGVLSSRPALALLAEGGA